MKAGAAMKHVAGEVESIVYRSAEDDWVVLRVVCRETSKRIAVVGHSGCQPGQIIEADGEWRENPPYGMQFAAARIVALSPTTPHGLASYLGSGVLPGVGPKLAQQMVQHFGMTLLEVLDAAPERVGEVRGIGPAKAARVVNGWKAQAAMREIMLFLHSQGLSSALCRRVHRAFGDGAVDVIKSNPYRLCMEVSGIGFKTADVIGLNLAIPPSSDQRVTAGMVFQMDELTSVGHCGYERARFVASCAEMLELPATRVSDVLAAMLAVTGPDARFVMHDGVVYPIGLARAEEVIAEILGSAVGRVPPHHKRVNSELIEWAANTCGMKLAKKQAQAVEMGLTSSVAIITGGPGCGKTATLKVLLAAYKRLGLSVALAAPTGKAAQRASEATGMEARTVHRLLGLRGGDDEDDSTIHVDVLVIDETSMVDVPLMTRIVRALRERTVLVMVGDVDQLPSVGPGQVLADCIRSGALPVTILDEVFRQAAGSAIITNAHAINHGLMPVSAGRGGDFFVLTEQNSQPIADALRLDDEEGRPAAVAEAVAREIEGLVARRLPGAYEVDPIQDIQVLAPMNKGACGVLELNRRLQQLLNPHPAQFVQHHGVRFGVGDKVIQRKNNYALDIFNGDVGRVHSVGGDDEVLNVVIDGRTVPIPFDDLGDLALAYAMTIHKSQGSQTPVAIVPMVTQHWNMLQRNLLYTAVTRASRLAIVIGQQRALSTAVRTVSSAHRTTRLKDLLIAGKGRMPAIESAAMRSVSAPAAQACL